MAMQGLFITGTNTGVGKTFVAARIASQLRTNGVCVGAYKPVCSGSTLGQTATETWEDVQLLSEAIGEEFPTDKICPQCFSAAVAPPVAARMENRCVDSTLLHDGMSWWRERVELLLVEGAGGLLSPLSEDVLNADLAQQMGLPLIVVARNELGIINHTLLTIEAAQNRGLNVAAVLINDVDPSRVDDSTASNSEEIARRISPIALAAIPHFPRSGLLQRDCLSTIDWMEMASSPTQD